MSARVITLRVTDESSGLRLDAFLAAQVPQNTRSAWKRLIEDRRVALDGRTASKPGALIRAGMRIEATLPDPEPSGLVGERIPIELVYEDEDLAVVMKPAGLVVHPGSGIRRGTLVHALLGRGVELAPAGGTDRPGIVHRLDKDTSGLLLVAKSDTAHRALSRMFARREIRKTYLAWVWGHPRPAAGRIEAAIGRSRRDRTRMAVGTRHGRHATTIYRTLETLPAASLLEIDLVTGRTHQIRVHFAARRHPVLGDRAYGGAPWKNLRDPELRGVLVSFPRLALHAAQLALVHPISGRPLQFSAPPPSELSTLAELLRRPR